MLFGLLRAVPMLLMVAGFPLLAVRGEWLDAVMCIVLGFATLTVGALAEARVKEKAESETKANNDGNDDIPKPNPPVAETVAAPIPAPVAATTEQKPVSEKCLTRDCRNPRTPKDGGLHWWCYDCWDNRQHEFGKKGVLQCVTEGCTKEVGHILDPWCRGCARFRKEQSKDPIRTDDGRFVDSHAERHIANFLYRNHIRYEYARQLAGSGIPPRKCDFFLPAATGGDGGVHIEYFGLANHDNQTKRDEYRQTMKWKRDYYRRSKLDLLEVLPEHQDNLEAYLTAELNKRGYKIGGK